MAMISGREEPTICTLNNSTAKHRIISWELSNKCSNHVLTTEWPLLLTGFTFSPNIYKQSHVQLSAERNYLSIPKLQRYDS